MATWTKEQTDDGRWGIAGPGPAYVAVSVFEEDADEIIADHEAREKLTRAEAALERIIDCIENDPAYEDDDEFAVLNHAQSLVTAALRDLRDAGA